jgi:hypothetical protein
MIPGAGVLPPVESLPTGIVLEAIKERPSDHSMTLAVHHRAAHEANHIHPAEHFVHVAKKKRPKGS